MKKTNVKYLATAVAAGGVILTSMTGAAFAETVPVYLTAAATPIDVTIGTGVASDSHAHGANAVYMEAAADSNTAIVPNLVVENNSTSSPIYVTGISLGNIAEGYTNTSCDDDYAAKAVGSKNFGLAVTGKNNVSITAVDLKNGYHAVDTVAASASLVYNLSGKVSASSIAVDEVRIANCVITVSQTNE